MPEKKQKAWIVAVDMGYGHQRPAHALRHLSKNPVITANVYDGIPEKDTNIWESSRRFYEMISRFKQVPLVGNIIFNIYDHFQNISQFYPRRDLSRPTLQINKIYNLIAKGWGKDLINKLSNDPVPIITTFFICAFMAEEHGYPGKIFCLTTDSDVSRAWVPKNPEESRIIYLASTERVRERLIEYGIRKQNIFFTGYPLPLENIGDLEMNHVKRRILSRLRNLDPHKKYFVKYSQNIMRFLHEETYPEKSDHPLTVSFAIGGAGAQSEIVFQILESLKTDILDGSIHFNIITATHHHLTEMFEKKLGKGSFKHVLGKSLHLIHAKTKDEYFETFNKMLDTTDILWTKPSELSFFAGLGVPLILAPPVGSQEVFNRRWLKNIGSATDQRSPNSLRDWFWDSIRHGWFAKMAMLGFVEMPLQGTINIENVIDRTCGS